MLLVKYWWNWHQVAAWFPDMFCNTYIVKNHKIANNSTTAKPGKMSTDLEFLEFKIFSDVYNIQSKNYPILLKQINHRFLVTTKLFAGWKILICNLTNTDIK